MTELVFEDGDYTVAVHELDAFTFAHVNDDTFVLGLFSDDGTFVKYHTSRDKLTAVLDYVNAALHQGGQHE